MASKDEGPPPKWTHDVPPPEAATVAEDGRFRAELTCYVQKGGRVKDIRVRGPIRETRAEARRDAKELRHAALRGGYDPALFKVRQRRKELDTVKWKDKDLTGPDAADDADDDKASAESAEDAAVRKALEELKKQDASHSEALSKVQSRISGGQIGAYKPVGPNWKQPGSLVQLPVLKDHPPAAWMIHERQLPTGKYSAWLFFNTATGKYYRTKEGGNGWVQTGVPNDPETLPIALRVASTTLQTPAGKKLNMAVLLPELHRTGFLLKQPLEFLDGPASLFVLVDGLRNSAAAAEFCAKRFHSVLLPKLSARQTEWEDFELTDVLRDSVEALDSALLEAPACFAGCSFAVALLAGTRLVVGSLGGVRCLLCRPPPTRDISRSASVEAQRKAAEQNAKRPWISKLLGGGDEHTLASDDERFRIESSGNRVFDTTRGSPEAGISGELRATGAKPAHLLTIKDEKERELVRISRATNPFQALGVASAELKEGPQAIRKTFRRKSLVVHPDKAGDSLRERAVSVFAKLEACASSIEAMLQADQTATVLLAQIDEAFEEGKLSADPSVAAKLLGLQLQEGLTRAKVKEAVKKRFHGPLARLQNASHKDVARALNILDLAEEAVVRNTQLWLPPDCDEALRVTRALGCKDLKTPVPLLSVGLSTEIFELETGSVCGLVLLSNACRHVNDNEVAEQISKYSPLRPRLAALKIANDSARRAVLKSSSGESQEAVGVICAYLDYESGTSTSSSNIGGQPAAKRAKLAGRPDRVRVSHILLKWQGLKMEDEFVRMDRPLENTRSQVEAEKMLLDLLEELSSGDPKTLGSRFKAAVLKSSECSTALNVPYADLGWIDVGGAEPPLEVAAFDTPVGGLSDIVLTSRGAHLLYRLA